MNKLYRWDLYDKNKIDMNRLATTVDEAWVTSGYVIAKDIDEAKRKISDGFDIESGRFILNFDLGESFMEEPYVQDNKNTDIFIKEFLLDESN